MEKKTEKSILDKIKEVFTKVETQKFLDIKLEDGVTIVSVDGEEFVKDAILYIVDDAGRNPANPGDYKLEDGRMIVVGEGGVIVEVKEPMMEEEEMASEVAGPSIEERVANIEKALEMIVNGMTSNSEAFSKLKAENEALKVEKEKLENTPMVKPTVTAKFETEKPLSQMSRLERIQFMKENKEN